MSIFSPTRWKARRIAKEADRMKAARRSAAAKKAAQTRASKKAA